MGRGPKPAKSKAAKPPVARKSRKNEGSTGQDLEKRLAESLAREEVTGKLLEEKTRALTEAHAQVSEALEQQTATSEILRIISQSPTDVQPVFDTIVASAARLCQAAFATLHRFDGQALTFEAQHGMRKVELEQARQSFPQPAGRHKATGRAVLDRRVAHIHDIREDQEYLVRSYQEDYRTVLAVPLIREGVPVGAFAVWRREVQPFSDQQIELVKTFADQAVIAIENVRLFNETKEALDRQTATSEILRVISSSPTDVQPVFDAIAKSSRQLCKGEYCVVESFDGECLYFGASDGLSPEGLAAFRRALPRPVSEDNAAGRAVLRRMVAQIPDVLEDPTHGVRSVALAANYRSTVAVPMLQHGQPIGAIVLARSAVGLFPEQQVELLKTFADQAVIAIENVRLFKELQTSNHDLKTSLEQQTATSEVLRVISSSPTDVQPVFDTIVGTGARLCEADFAMLARYDGTSMSVAAHSGATNEEIDTVRQVYPMAPTPETLGGRTILERAVVHIPDVSRDPTYGPRVIKDAGWRTGLGIPLLREGVAIGAMGMWRRDVRPFTDRQIELLKTFADQAVIAIENVRLFNETKEALDRQTATSEILRVIASSPTDVQPVFDAIVQSATRLCDADFGIAFRFDGQIVTPVALHNMAPDESQIISPAVAEGRGVSATRATVAGRAVLDASVVHIHDLREDSSITMPAYKNVPGYRTVLAVPMLRGGRPIGSINVWRREIRPFSEQHIELLQTFAHQAVIAIENVRLFTELQQKNEALTQAHAQVSESLEQQTATSEILRVISQSPTDAKPVFDTIVRSSARLCNAVHAVVVLTDGTTIDVPANYGRSSPEALAAARAMWPRPLDMTTTAGAAILTRSVVQMQDTEDPSVSDFLRRAGRLLGYRSSLAVPMLRGVEAIGAIRVARREPNRFSDAEVELLKTFADQAVIAIENVRLFKELEVANRELAAASQHKSEFLANMSHELRTPLNAIIGFSEVLSERMFGELNEKQEEYSKDIHASGQHLLSLINDILDLSKIEAGRMELELSDFHLPTALDSALTLVRERAGRRSIALHLSVDERLGQIQADERKVRQVVLNLLSNAIKFTPEGGRIAVAAVSRDGSVEVSVSDTGIGIAPGDHEAVFQEFRQVGTAEKKAEGTGLGLTLCRKFVELHGGKIWVKSELGAGSTFTFTIPTAT